MYPAQVLIVDDHAIVRSGLSMLLGSVDGITIVGEADDGEQAVNLVRKLRPDLVVMDLIMPNMDGIEATHQIKQIAPKTKVLVLTTSMVSDDIVRAFEAGADGAVTKSTDNDTLITAVEAIVTGGRWFSPELRDLIKRDPPVPRLTDRQTEILDLVSRGFTNAEIARFLNIAEGSVKDHCIVIFQKIGASNRAEAVNIALRKHLIKI